MKKQETVDPVPVLTPQRLAENEEFQRNLRERFTLRPQNHAERVIADSMAIIDILIDQRKFQDKETRKQIDDRIKALKRETALYLKQLGHFDMALQYAQGKREKALCRRLVKALKRPDAEWCKHAKWKEVDGHKLPNYGREFSFREQFTGRELSVIKCFECDFRNVIETPKDLANLSANRAKVRDAMVSNGLRTLADVKRAGLETDLAKLANG